MSWRSSLLFLAVSCYGQTAITELTSFWEMNPALPDRILWDSRGSKHGFATGYGVEAPGTIFGGGIKQNTSLVGGGAIPSDLLTLSGTWTIGVWCRNNGATAILSKGSSGSQQILLRFSNTFQGRPDVYYRMEDNTNRYFISTNTDSNKSSSGDLVLVWLAYDDATGQMKIAANATAFATETPPSPFVQGTSEQLDIGQIGQSSGRGTVVGRMMYWSGYIPSDAERSAIYNGGSGQDYTYFNAAGFTPPTAPLTPTLVNATFAQDSNLTGQQGLYWLRPYPLYSWSPALAASLGNYPWFRSTDHGAGGIYMGFSASPESLPASWSEPVTAAALSVDSGQSWEALETPYAEWDSENSRVLLYAKARLVGKLLRSTHVWSSTDFVTWTWRGEALPYGTIVDGRSANHTGYASVKWVSSGNWVAQSLLNDTGSGSARFGTWSSEDGITWSSTGVTTCMNTLAPYTTNLCEVSDASSSYVAGGIMGGGVNQSFSSGRSSFAMGVYPPRLLLTHGGTGTGGDWLQSVRAYEESGTVYLYAKWSYQEPSTIRLYKGTLPQSSSPRFGGALRIGGTASVK